MAYSGRGAGTSLRAPANLRRNSIEMGVAPQHQDYDFGTRLTVRCTPYQLGRTGTTYTGQNQVIKNTQNAFASPNAYSSAIAFPNCNYLNTGSAPSSIVGWASSVYSATGTAEVNFVTSLLKFYNAIAVRRVVAHYTPTCPTTTSGTLVFASKVIANQETITRTLDETTFSDLTGLPCVTTAVSAPTSFVVKPMIKPNVASADIISPAQALNVYASHLLLIAVDLTLGAGSSDVLGDLTLEVTLDCYGRQWNALDTVSVQTHEEKKIEDVVKRLLAPVAVKPQLDSKESKSEEMKEWELLENERVEREKKLCEQKAYRASILNAQKSLDSGSTSSTVTATAPNVTSRTPRP